VKNFLNLAAGVLLGLLVAWLLGLFRPGTTAPTDLGATPISVSSAPARPVIVTVAATRSDVVMPAASAVPAHAPAAAPATASGPPVPANSVRQQSRVKAMTNNLRVIGSAAQQFMGEKGVTQASYYDLVGTDTDNYVRSVSPVMGEDYSGIIVSQTDTQVMVVAPDGTMVTFDF